MLRACESRPLPGPSAGPTPRPGRRLTHVDPVLLMAFVAASLPRVLPSGLGPRGSSAQHRLAGTLLTLAAHACPNHLHPPPRPALWALGQTP